MTIAVDWEVKCHVTTYLTSVFMRKGFLQRKRTVRKPVDCIRTHFPLLIYHLLTAQPSLQAVISGRGSQVWYDVLEYRCCYYNLKVTTEPTKSASVAKTPTVASATIKPKMFCNLDTASQTATP